MTNFSADESRLADAIYGGPRLEPAIAARLLAGWGLTGSSPLHVVAIDAPRALPSALLPKQIPHRLLAVHPGIAYVFVAGDDGLAKLHRAVRTHSLVMGEPRTCSEPRELVSAIQQAVLSLRRAQLGPGSASAFTQLAEQQARALALHRVRTRHADASEAVSSWLGIVMARHQDRLNTVRRKLLEGLCLLTLEQDASAELAYPFHSAARRLLDTYSLPALRTVFEQALRDIAPLLTSAGEPTTGSLVHDARAYLTAHYHEDVGLAQTARHLRCSPTHLSRAFKQSTGRTLTAYLQSLRIARAKELLLETDGPLRVVGPTAGFETAKHFHRVFLAQTGMTPHAFRAAYRQ